MKKVCKIMLTMLVLVSGIGLSSCVETSCEAGESYKMVYLEEPYKYQNWCNKHYYTVVAHLIPEYVPDSMIYSHHYSAPYAHYKLCGSIPKDFRNGQIMHVEASIKPYRPCGHILIAGVPSPDYDSIGGWNIYKITCVQK